MGNVHLTRREERPRVLLVGLESSGKTALLYRLTEHHFILTVPTIGVTEEPLSIASAVDVTMWDVGGLSSQRRLWQMCFSAVDIVVFVIDASSASRVEECRSELQRLSHHEVLSRAPLLVLANKQDRTGAVSAVDVADRLDLGRTFMGKGWTVVGTSAKTGQGLDEVLFWLQMKLKCQKKDISRRRRRGASLDIQDIKKSLSATQETAQTSPAVAALVAAERKDSSCDLLSSTSSNGVFEERLSTERERKKIRSVEPCQERSSLERLSGDLCISRLRRSRSKGGDEDTEVSTPASGSSHFSLSSPRALSSCPTSPSKTVSRSDSINSDASTKASAISRSLPQHFPLPTISKKPLHSEIIVPCQFRNEGASSSNSSVRVQQRELTCSENAKIEQFMAKAAAMSVDETNKISPSSSRGRLPSVLEDEELVLKEDDALFVQSVVDNRNGAIFRDSSHVRNSELSDDDDDDDDNEFDEEDDYEDEEGDFSSESDSTPSDRSDSPLTMDTSSIVVPSTCRVISTTPAAIPSFAY